MTTIDDLCKQIRGVSDKPIPCVFLDLQWIADVQPEQVYWYHNCVEECLEYAYHLLERRDPIEVIGDIRHVRSPHFAATAQRVRIGTKCTLKLLRILETVGLNPDQLFGPYSLDKDLLTGVQYSHARSRQGKVQRVWRRRDILGELDESFVSTPGFQSVGDREEEPMKWIADVVILNLAEAAIEAIQQRLPEQSSSRDISSVSSSSKAGTEKSCPEIVENVPPSDDDKKKTGKRKGAKSSGNVDESGKTTTAFEAWKYVVLEHHQHRGQFNTVPIEPRQVEKRAREIGYDVCSYSTAWRYFKKRFESYKEYCRICKHDVNKLRIQLQLLAGDYSLSNVREIKGEIMDTKAVNPADLDYD